ncbi:conserved hypothetical protein [Trichinella spiralis]|uniref:hypothetical protein n=1 Tax=Trichinella spiralis TaxID=6334 RepID=UPI0001EFEA0D|nr:conserved hypothetical protein [Trichinella spiralis]
MYGHRAKRFPKLSTHRRDLQIPFPFGTTKAGDNFLLWQNASKHILVCATGYNIKLLAAMRTWVMDGTFKIVPQGHHQLFTIPAFVSRKINALVQTIYPLIELDPFYVHPVNRLLHFKSPIEPHQ